MDLLKRTVPELLGKPLYIPPIIDKKDALPNYEVDIDRVKKLAIQSWSGNRLVKVVSAKKVPASAVDGYITLEKFIVGQDCGGMARRLGLPGELVRPGVFVMRLIRLPNPAEFELRGYTNTPAGKQYDSKSDYLPGTGVPQWKLVRPVPADPVRDPTGKPKLFAPGVPYRP